MSPFTFARTASLLISLFGAIFNFALALQVFSLWVSFKREPESEWEGMADVWKLDGVKLVWGILTTYFAAAATACLFGFIGIVKNIPSFVRFYRDYSIADFSFCALLTTVGGYAAFRTPVRASICEQLSQQPQLMGDMVELGLNLENCELWIERGVFAFLVAMLFLIVIRLHFLIAVSNYYKHLAWSRRTILPSYGSSHSHSRTRSGSLQRIYLLPAAPSSSSSSQSPASASDDDLLYAPVPLRELGSKVARDLRASATEAWVSHPTATVPETHRHRGHQSLSSTTGGGGAGNAVGTGRICLPLSPDEALLPDYEVKG